MAWTRWTAVAAVAVLTAWAVPAAADEEYGRSGPYVGLGATYAFEEFSSDAKSADNTWGYHFAAGYRFNEYFALEVGNEQYVNFDVRGGDVDIIAPNLSAKLFPLHGMVQPYLAAGAGWTWIDDDRGRSTNVFFARFAGGVDLYLSRNWVLFGEVGYFLPTGDGADYDAVPLTFGVMYRFF